MPNHTSIRKMIKTGLITKKYEDIKDKIFNLHEIDSHLDLMSVNAAIMWKDKTQPSGYNYECFSQEFLYSIMDDLNGTFQRLNNARGRGPRWNTDNFAKNYLAGDWRNKPVTKYFVMAGKTPNGKDIYINIDEYEKIPSDHNYSYGLTTYFKDFCETGIRLEVVSS